MTTGIMMIITMMTMNMLMIMVEKIPIITAEKVATIQIAMKNTTERTIEKTFMMNLTQEKDLMIMNMTSMQRNLFPKIMNIMSLEV